MRSLSAQAWCMWTFFYAASNGHGRFQLDYKLILATAFRYYPVTPSEAEVHGWLREYKERYLLFVYKAEDGALWGAFDSKSGQRYFNADDKRSPVPPEPQFSEWMSAYADKKKSKSARKLVSALDDLLDSTPKQHDLGFGVDSTLNERSLNVEPPQLNTETLHNKPQHNVLNTTPAEFPKNENAPEVEEPEWVDEKPNRWRALLFAADTAGMLYAEGQIESIQRRWGEYTEAQQLAAIAGIELRLKTGEYADAHFVPRLRRYVFEGLWTAKLCAGPRLVQPPPNSQKAITERFLKRMAREQAEKQAEERGLLKSG